MRRYSSKPMMFVIIVGLALGMGGGFLASAADQPGANANIKRINISIQSSDGTPVRTYNGFDATEVKVDGDTLTIAGTIKDRVHNETASLLLTLPVQSEGRAHQGSRWNRRYDEEVRQSMFAPDGD